MKRIYQTAAEASLCCLLSCGVSALPVKPVRIVMHYDVPCLDCAHPLLEGEIGRIIKRADGRVQIVLDPSKPIPQKRFAVAHELGHYLLGHLDRPPEPEDECNADSFADGVLMPLCVLYGVRAFDTSTISRVCKVPHAAAQRCSDGLKAFRKKGKPESILEHQVCKQFRQFIDSSR